MSDSLLEIRNLTKRYGENTVLRDLSLYGTEGRGHRSAGAQRLRQKHPAAMYQRPGADPGGEILLGGEVIDRSPAGLPALRRRIGMVFQSYEPVPPYDGDGKHSAGAM